MPEQLTSFFESIQSHVALYGGRVLLAILVLLIGLWIIKRVVRTVSRISEKQVPDETLARFLGSATDILLKVVLIISVASIIGIETTSFIAVLGAAGLAIGLALQGSLSNFAGGVMLLLFRPIKVGEYVEAQGYEGVVEDIGIFVTTLKTFDERVIVIPNGSLANDTIINHTRSETRAVEVAIGVGYSDNLAEARTAMQAVLSRDERVLKDRDHVVEVVDLGASSVDFLVRAFVNTDDYWAVFFDLRPALKSAVENAGCSIPFPQRDVHLIQETG
ncbi:MAG: mechanosensitive ion channel domain-containing protein [Pseudomonadota bacterium]